MNPGPDRHGHGFPRAARLLRPKEYQYVFADPGRLHHRLFTVLYRPGTAATGPRLGLAVAKRRIPAAVGRNRFKRLVRESFRMHARGLPPVDVVVLARDGARGATNTELSQALEHVWRRLLAPHH